MADRHTEKGRELQRGERERRAAEAPPGSRARAESDVTGWSPERDEPPSTREGRFHRAARLRMAQPRTGPPERIPAVSHGPYGGDDRTYESASGQGSGMLTGEQDWWHSLDVPHPPRDYRPWDRTGAGADPPELGRDPRPEEQRYEERRREDRSEPRGMDGDYAGLVGMGQGVPSREGRSEAGTGRRGRWKREPRVAREVMTRHVKSAHLDSRLREVARIMKDEDCGIVPVVDERGRLRGVLTDRDIVIRTLAEGRPPDDMRARDVMTDDVEAVTPDEDVHGIIAMMGRRQVRRVPVVERDDRLVGIISMADIATRAHYDEELQEALDRISARRSFWSRLH